LRRLAELAAEALDVDEVTRTASAAVAVDVST
jgi:hypothetical protein